MSTQNLGPPYAGDRLEELLTIANVARLLGVSRWSVYELMRAGELVPIRVGERARFEPAAICAYLERHRERKPGP
jgi:excisionase family DNA binding protein